MAKGTAAKRQSTTTAPETTIPISSTLANFIRRGAEGVCMACRGKIREHYGHKGVWRGCHAAGLLDAAVFMLVPVAMPNGQARQIVRGFAHGTPPVPVIAHDKTGKTAESRAKAAGRPVQPINRLAPRFLYEVKDRRKKAPQTLSAAYRDTYSALLKAKTPVTANDAAKLAKRPSAANRQRLEMLVMAGLATKTAVEAAGAL